MGFLLSIPLHRLELISFSANLATSVAMATLFFVSWTYKYFILAFRQHLATSVAMATLFSFF